MIIFAEADTYGIVKNDGYSRFVVENGEKTLMANSVLNGSQVENQLHL